MRLGLNLGMWSSGAGYGDPADLDLAVTADGLGLDVVWVAEAYGSDAVSVLSFLAARTSRIGLGAGVLQVPARSAAMTAMTAATLDRLSGGRFRLGLGVSGKQVSEGWHGVAFDHPIARLREYVEVVRAALAREPLAHQGAHLRIPPEGSSAKSIRLAQRPLRPDMPLYLAALGPRALELVGEAADGWLGFLCDDVWVREAMERIAVGRSRAPEVLRGRPVDVVVNLPLVLTDAPGGPVLDLEQARDLVRPYAALYVGGMGGPDDNVYNAQARRMGFDEAARRVQSLFLSGQVRDAAAALPPALIDRVALVGSVETVAARLRAFADAGVTTVAVMPFAPRHEGSPDARAAMLAGLQAAAERAGAAG